MDVDSSRELGRCSFFEQSSFDDAGLRPNGRTALDDPNVVVMSMAVSRQQRCIVLRACPGGFQ